MDKRAIRDLLHDESTASGSNYLGPGFKIDSIPYEVEFGPECADAEDVRDEFMGQLEAVEYPDVVETGYRLIEAVEAMDLPVRSRLDKDLPRSRRQILTEAVVLAGVRALCHAELREFTGAKNISWGKDEQIYRLSCSVAAPELQGLAIFITSRPCAERRMLLRGAFSSLPNADFRVVIANMDNDREDCIPTLASNEYILLVSLLGREYRLYDHHGLVA
jgi:hypothetical protein